MLVKSVNGVETVCSAEEEAAILAEWAANNPASKTPAQLDAELLDDMIRQVANSKLGKLLFDINFDQENRLRTQAGQPTLTRAQYRNGLLTVWRNL